MADKNFPLWLHGASGHWAKKHKGTIYYFGKDKQQAYARYLAEWPAIIAGKAQRPANPATLQLRDVINHFLTSKKTALDAGRLSPSMWYTYTRAANLLIDTFGRERLVAELRPDDFAAFAAKLSHYGPVTIAGIITRVKSIFKHAYDFELIDKPLRFGPGLAKPSLKEMRLAKKSKLLTAAQVRTLIDAAKPPLKAMVLLGINCGFGQADCSELPTTALAREGWIEFPRPKTGIARRCPLWPETVAAIKEAYKARPKPTAKEDAGLLFITKYGRRFIRYNPGTVAKPGSRTDGIGQEYAKLAKATKTPTGFYRLRHCFRTAADAALDPVACDAIMGHVDASMAGNYRGGIGDDRLIAVTNKVREWLQS